MCCMHCPIFEPIGMNTQWKMFNIPNCIQHADDANPNNPPKKHQMYPKWKKKSFRKHKERVQDKMSAICLAKSKLKSYKSENSPEHFFLTLCCSQQLMDSAYRSEWRQCISGRERPGSNHTQLHVPHTFIIFPQDTLQVHYPHEQANNSISSLTFRQKIQKRSNLKDRIDCLSKTRLLHNAERERA